MGMDVTSLMSVPLFIMEPFSMLQKMAEIMEYTQLLDQANAAEDPYERCVQRPHSQQVAMQNSVQHTACIEVAAHLVSCAHPTFTFTGVSRGPAIASLGCSF